MLRPLTDEAVDALQASGASARIEGGGLRLSYERGDWDGSNGILVSLEHAGTAVGELRLGPRLGGRRHTDNDRELLRRCGEAAVAAVLLARSRDAAPTRPA